MKLYDLVLSLLKTHEQLRDDDKKLVWSVWYKLGYATDTVLTKDAFMQKRCPSSDTITRCSRKIKEIHEELRGKDEIIALKKEIEKEKGTHIFHETVDEKKSIEGHYEKRGDTEVWVYD